MLFSAPVAASDPKISVITVVYNCRRTIEDALDSVLSQTHKNIEHIVIDGNSTDGTMDVLRARRDDIAELVSEPDDGIYDAMNKGIALATGDIIGTLNADDVYAGPDVLASVADTLSDESIDACYADLVYVDQTDLNRVVRYWKSRTYKDGLFRRGWVPAHPTFFVKRHVYEEYGAFDLEFRLAADFELMLRFLARHGVRAAYIPKVFIKMRLGGVTNQSWRNIVKQNVEILRAGRKNHVPISPLHFSTKVLARISQFVRRPAAQ